MARILRSCYIVVLVCVVVLDQPVPLTGVTLNINVRFLPIWRFGDLQQQVAEWRKISGRRSMGFILTLMLQPVICAAVLGFGNLARFSKPI
jgi:hypothetical protein